MSNRHNGPSVQVVAAPGNGRSAHYTQFNFRVTLTASGSVHYS